MSAFYHINPISSNAPCCGRENARGKLPRGKFPLPSCVCTLSGTGGFVSFQPETEKCIARHHKNKAQKRKEYQRNVVRPAYEVKKRVILEQSDGYDIGAEFEDPFAVDRQRVFSEFTAAVGKYVPKLDPFNCKETFPRRQDKQR